jgi:uncharacterized alpha/beta hydrolase family protein
LKKKLAKKPIVIIIIIIMIIIIIIIKRGCHSVVESSSTHRQRSYSKQAKGKPIPLQALTGPEGSRRLRLPDFKTIGT